MVPRARRLLDAGRRFCFLYTDATNPTSNKIYAGLGYVLYRDMVLTRRIDTEATAFET